MQRLKVKYFLLGGLILGPIFTFLLLGLRGIGDRPNPDYVAIENAAKGVQCPDGAIMEYAPWGKSGRLAQCHLTHGVFIAAEHGRIIVKQEYDLGKLISEEKPD